MERGSTIEAALSQGPERYPMPVVVGLTRAAAEGAIEKAKLSVGKVVDGFSEKVAAGTVLRASESPGARLKKGTRIDLVVSVGPKPLVITNYQGTPYDSAARRPQCRRVPGRRAKCVLQEGRQGPRAPSGPTLWSRRTRRHHHPHPITRSQGGNGA